MPTTLGIICTEGVLWDLVRNRSRSRSCEAVDLTFFATSEPTDPGSVTAGGVVLADSIPGVVASSDVILVATQPEATVATLETLARIVSEDHIVIVSSTDVGLDRMRLALGPGPALLKVVLDPVGAGKGVLVACAEAGTAAETVERAAGALACMGIVETIPEESLGAARAVIEASRDCLVTALAGMEDGAVNAGLPADVARSFVRQTAMATALLLQDHPGSPADLKDQVASPGGTTIAGLAVLEDLGVRGAFLRAVESAVLQTREGQDVDQSNVVE